MSAVVCGKRSLFEDIHGSPPIAKRIRCGGNSPIRFPSVVSPLRVGTAGGSEAGSLGRPTVSFVDDQQLLQLRDLFSEMDGQLVERVYESCGKNLDSAIKSLNDLRLSSNEQLSSPSENSVHAGAGAAAVTTSVNCGVSSDGYPQSSNVQVSSGEANMPTASVPTEGSEWVDMLVKEMMSATDLEDAKMRATRALEAFEKTVASRSGIVVELMKKENATLKEQLQGLLRDNHILKRAVAIQHERQLEHEDRSRELQAVKQLLAQHQEQLRSLELNNYALSLHLRKAQEVEGNRKGLPDENVRNALLALRSRDFVRFTQTYSTEHTPTVVENNANLEESLTSLEARIRTKLCCPLQYNLQISDRTEMNPIVYPTTTGAKVT